MKIAHRNAHRVMWMALAVLIPAMIIAAFTIWRQDPSDLPPPERLSGPDEAAAPREEARS